MQSLFRYPFVIPIIVGLAAECVKILYEGIRRQAWHEGILRPGGMPSSHSAFVMSLLIVLAGHDGLQSTTFAIGIVLACITWYDAASSRRAIGDQARILNTLQKKEHFSERIGHSLREVIGGIVFGGILTALLYVLR